MEFEFQHFGVALT